MQYASIVCLTVPLLYISSIVCSRYIDFGLSMCRGNNLAKVLKQNLVNTCEPIRGSEFFLKV
jgi:hypothetical protein